MRAKPHTEGGAEQGLELVEVGVVDDAGDHLAHVVGMARIARHDAVDLARIVARRGGRAQVHGHRLDAIEPRHGLARQLQRMTVVAGVVVGDARGAAVDIGAAQVLGADDLAGGGAYQRRTAEKNRALLAHDDGFIRHRRQIGAAGGAGTHHHGDLRNAFR